MRAYDVIQRKRDGNPLPADMIQSLIKGYLNGEVADYQIAAFAMAVYFRGMSTEEVTALTHAMLHSGTVVELSDVNGIKVDKHSTGGVGDKISLPLAPAVSACGVPVPMISGRGLGHTGGTLDKLESIPGFRVDLSLADYRRLVKQVGCCLIGQTAEIAPADKKLYALRDVTATVDCIPLIASSIMSKKLAEGIDALVLDVKVGSGAFMKSVRMARELAMAMIDIGAAMNKRVVARLTSMEEPIGRFVGNALEVHESIDVLEGKGPSDTVALTVELGAEMLLLGKVVATMEAGRARIEQVLRDGSAREQFGRIIEAQGGNRRVLDDRRLLVCASKRTDFVATHAGVISHIDTESVGIASMLLGGGRQRAADKVDHRVGLEILKRRGDRVAAGEPIVALHHEDVGVDAAKDRLRDAYVISNKAPAAEPLFIERLAG
jgi:pyrimidine-nucleoside phosphorylase